MPTLKGQATTSTPLMLSSAHGIYVFPSIEGARPAFGTIRTTYATAPADNALDEEGDTLSCYLELLIRRLVYIQMAETYSESMASEPPGNHKATGIAL
jgi:hypothetical protein